MSYSMRFVVTPLPASDDTLYDCIKEAAIRHQRPNPVEPLTSASSSTSTAAAFNSASCNPYSQQTVTTTTATATTTTSSSTVVAIISSSSPSSALSNQPSVSNSGQPSSQQTHQYVGNTLTQQSLNQAPSRTTFNAIKSVPVTQIAAGPRHVALLLEDGRVCRASYQVLADRLEFPPASNSAHYSSITSSVANPHISNNPPAQPLPTQHSQTTSGSQSNISKAPLGSGLVGNPPGIGSVIASGGVATNLDGLGGSINTGSGAGAGVPVNPNSAGPGGSGPSGGPAGAPSGLAGAGSLSSSSVSAFSSRVVSSQVNSLAAQHRQAARRGGRMLRPTASRGRGATSVIMGSRSFIPAQYVPEDLINQAQGVLQGKPRSAIVRELQRTNLDINSAVNNLLSSDNEDPEDMDESQDYLPNEDLMSLLDSSVNLPSGPTSVLIDAETVFPEDVFNSYSASRIRTTNLRHSVGSGRSNSDRESSLASELEVRRMASQRDQSQSRRWLEHALRDPQSSDNVSGRLNSATPTDFTLHHKNETNQSPCNNNSSKKNSTSNLTDINPIQISDTIEIWPTNDKRFVQIACMHSELIAISSTGQIHQWKWSDSVPFEGVRHGDVINYHPKVAQLNLTHEKIHLLSASCVRASVVTETSKVATWIDETISIVAGKLEHGAQNYPEFQRNDKISQLHTCSLYTCVRLESGSLYWWGVAPFSQRKKNWKRVQSKASKSHAGIASSNEIAVGSIVCLRNGPSFGDGALGFTTKDGVPRVGRLTMSAWNITDTCTFKIIQPSERKIQLAHSQNQQPIDPKSSSQRVRKMLGQPLDFSGNVSDDQAPSSPGISKNSSSERLEMPPPPSPASSTCSEPGCSPSHKRKHKHSIGSKDDDRFRDEEQWNLKDVIFLEEVKKPPAAKVIKLDGQTALVRFNQRDPFGQSDSDVNAYLQDCRMIRKEELQLARETPSSSRIIDCQRSPKKLSISDSGNFITFTVSNNGIHALVKNGSKIEYKMYQLASGKVSKSLALSTDTNAFLGRDSSLITLYACGENDIAVTLRDGNGCLYPLAKDFLESIREPQALDMAPIQALCMAIHPLRDPNNINRTNPTLIMALAVESQILIPAVLQSDPEIVRLTLASLDKEPVSQQIVASEKIDLNRNVLHVAVYSCAPTPTGSSNSDRIKLNEDSFETFSSGLSRISGTLNDSIKRSRSKQSHTVTSPLSQTPATLDLTSDNNDKNSHSTTAPPTASSRSNEQDLSISLGYEASADWSNSILNKVDIDPTEQKQSAHIVLLTLVECPMIRPFLKDLMIQRDAHSMTPFMLAVSYRAYSAAIILLDLAQWITNQEENTDPSYRRRLFYSMIYPPDSNLDNNPLYMLCANDTCSFTWTGAQHINQDIFECKTCGLTRTLCCCTECARTCHKGHDCRLKKTSPTAYCDCWEKCKCKSLVAGSHFTRFKLLERLLADTDLVTYPDTRGESILLFLVQTVGRQMIEQRQYAPDRSSRHNKRDDPVDMPEHDLSPPRFARKALHKMLGEWLALKTVIMSGASSSQNIANATRVNPLLNAEDQLLLAGQHGTALLDRFTHSILIKIGPEMLDVLLRTVIREYSSTIPGRANEARIVAKRFVRSVARNGVVLSIELSPINYSQPMNMMDLPSMLNQISSSPYGANGGGSGSSGAGGGSSGAVGTGANSGSSSTGSWKPSQHPTSILQKCRKVFQALLPIAAEELAEIADALISPVRLGVPRPTAPFSLVNSMAEATAGSEEIFVVDPVVMRQATNIVDPVTPRTGPATSTMPSSAPVSSSGGVTVSGLGGSGSTSAGSASGIGGNVGTNEPPLLNENLASMDRVRDMIFDNEMAIEAIDSEDAEASNNTFRRSNNGETDSDSDSNLDDASFQSNIDPNIARSTTTGATAGSEVGASTVAYFSEADSGDSSNADEDEESETNDTEHDNDDIPYAHEDSFSFPRRSTTVNHPDANNLQLQQAQQSTFRSTNLGQQLHWALRHRDHSFYPPQPGASLPSTAARLASIGLANAYSYLDGAPRRSVMANSSQSSHLATSNNELSMSTTSVGLSRAFSIIIRSISDLIPILKETERFDPALAINQLKVSPNEAATIICNIEKKLNPVWEWLFKVMDSTEGQLRFGCALTNGIQAATQSNISNPTYSHNLQPRNPTGIQAALSNPTSFAPSSYFPQASNLLPVNPAMLARVNANLTPHTLNRRVPTFFDESAQVRHHGSNSVAVNTSGSSDPQNVQRIQNSLSQASGVARPQSLTTRSNLNSGYVARMPFNEAAEIVDGTAARRDFLSYMISLIRGHGNEHHDSLPILDVSSLRHVAYVFDAYIYYIQALNRDKQSKPNDDFSDDEDLSTLSNTHSHSDSKHQFFRRSESTLFLDGATADPFGVPLAEALPLAEQPHLLQPNSRREDLFGITRSTVRNVSADSQPLQLSLSAPSSSTCPKCVPKQQQSSPQSQHLPQIPLIKTETLTKIPTGPQASALSSISPGDVDRNIHLCAQHRRDADIKSELQHTALLGRWRLAVELFGREFLDDVGAEPGSILTDLVGFPLKENRFRKEMERLRNDSTPREISLTNVDRDKNTLIRQTIKELNNTYHLSERNQSRRNQELPLLACSKVKVSFKDEKGEGNGVARSFYTAFCEAVLSNEKLANLDTPLFYQPGLRNFYSPRQGDASPDRLNAFRNVGRVIGICLSQSEICPIQLNRHVIKYILRKSIAWHDLAFFDPILYESLRQLVLDARTNPEANLTLQSLDLRFCVDLSTEEGGGQIELASGGKNIEVTSENIYEYVRRYALKRMLKSQEKALQAIRQGVMDVLPPCALDNLTAEDFRLLLNGVGEINVQTLINYTSFIDDRGTSAGKRNSVQVDEQLSYFKKWFWSIVEKMTTKERQDLVYFWTGSPSLPASEEGFQPMPTVSIRPAEDLHLPTSNVCIYRLYIPLYSSKSILKSKLLIAIKEKNFGFI